MNTEQLVSSLMECIGILEKQSCTPEEIGMGIACVQHADCATLALWSAVEMYATMIGSDNRKRVEFLHTHVRKEVVVALQALIVQIHNDARLEKSMELLKKRALSGMVDEHLARKN